MEIPDAQHTVAAAGQNGAATVDLSDRDRGQVTIGCGDVGSAGIELHRLGGAEVPQAGGGVIADRAGNRPAIEQGDVDCSDDVGVPAQGQSDRFGGGEVVQQDVIADADGGDSCVSTDATAKAVTQAVSVMVA